MNLLKDNKTKEIVQYIEDTKHKKDQNEKTEYEKNAIEKEIQNVMKEYNINRNSAELYTKYEMKKSKIINTIILIMIFVLLVICVIELANEGIWLEMLNLKL